MNYKFEGNAPEYISRDLRECAQMVSELDDKMLSLNEAIKKCLCDDSGAEGVNNSSEAMYNMQREERIKGVKERLES